VDGALFTAETNNALDCRVFVVTQAECRACRSDVEGLQAPFNVAEVSPAISGGKGYHCFITRDARRQQRKLITRVIDEGGVTMK